MTDDELLGPSVVDTSDYGPYLVCPVCKSGDHLNKQVTLDVAMEGIQRSSENPHAYMEHEGEKEESFSQTLWVGCGNCSWFYRPTSDKDDPWAQLIPEEAP